MGMIKPGFAATGKEEAKLRKKSWYAALDKDGASIPFSRRWLWQHFGKATDV